MPLRAVLSNERRLTKIGLHQMTAGHLVEETGLHTVSPWLQPARPWA